MQSSSDMEAKVLAMLQRHNVSYELIQIDPNYADTEEFCEHYGYPTSHSGNTIIVASKRGIKQYSACIVQATERLDVNKTVKKLMNVSRASFASSEETIQLTGMMIGGVTPYALPDSLPIYADFKLNSVEYLIIGSGSRSSKLKVHPSELNKIPNLQFIDGLSLA